MCPPTYDAVAAAKAKETYWPVLKSSLLNGDLFVKDLDMDCPICYDNMGVHPVRYGPEDENGNDHRAVILPCGHMVGNSCVKLGNFSKCPVCRASLEYTGCKHNHQGVTVPWRIKELNSVPKELSKGGYIADRCNFCQLNLLLPVLKSMLDNDKESHKNTPSSSLVILIKRPEGEFWSIGDITHDMKPTPIETPEPLRLTFDNFKQAQQEVVLRGEVWFEDALGDSGVEEELRGDSWGQDSFCNAQIECYTMERSNIAGILAIMDFLEVYGDDDESDDEDTLDNESDASEEDLLC